MANLRPCILAGTILATLSAAVTVPACADEATDQYAVASGHFRVKRWKLAAQEYQVFLDRWGKHELVPRVQFYLGEAHMELRQYADARKVLRELIAADPSFPYIARARFRTGQASWRLGDDKAARTELSAFLAMHPKDPLRELALPYLADALLALGEFAQARAQYEQSLSEFPRGQLADDSRYGLARALEQLGRIDDAITEYRAIAAGSSDLADDAQLNLGARLFETKQYQEAADILAQLPKKFPASELIASAQLNEGWARYQLGQYDAAADLFSRLDKHPQFGVEARYWQGLSYKALNRLEDAVNLLLAAAKNEQHRLAPHMEFHAADAMLQQGKIKRAAEYFVHVAQRWPRSDIADDSLFHACQAYLQLKQYDQVGALAAALAEHYPKSPLVASTRALVGQAYVGAGKFSEAVAVLQPAVIDTADSASISMRFYLGVAYQQLEQHEEALKAWEPLEKESDKDPLVVEAHYRMAASHFALEQHRDAVNLWEEFLRLAGDDAALTDRAVAYLAIAYAELKLPEQAFDNWRRLTAEFPKSSMAAAASYQTAEVLYSQQQFDRAEQLFQWTAANDASGQFRARSLSGAGWCQYDRRQFAQAAETLKRILADYADDPVAPEAALLRARALQSAGAAEDALAAYGTVLQKYPESPEAPSAALQQARLYVETKQLQAAAKAYIQLFERYPKLPQRDQVAYERAWVYVDLGDEDQAHAVFLQLAKEFPDSPLAADALLNVAEAHYRAMRYEEAGDVLGEVEKSIPRQADAVNRDRLTQALWYRQGRIAADRQQWKALRRPFEQLVAQFPKSEFATEAQFWLVEADYQQDDIDSAESRLNSLLESPEIQQAPWAATAWLRRIQVLVRRKRWQEALDAADDLKKQFPKFELTYEADYLMGRCLSSLPSPQFDRARQAFQRCIASAGGRKTETAAQAQFMIGETYFHQRNYERALREYLRVELLYAYPVWQAASLLEAGQCSEQLASSEQSAGGRRLQLQQAAKFYQRIVENKAYAKTEFAQAAGKRLAQVQKLLDATG